MNGDIYSNMPDTTARVSPYRRSIRRLVASMSLFASSLLLVASMGLAQDGVSCEEFTTPEDAQVALDEDQDLAVALDGNGNGVACDEDRSVFTGGTDLEERDEFADEIEDDSTNETEDDSENDSGASAGQAQQTPATGGVALLPLAGSALMAGFGGFMLLRRR